MITSEKVLGTARTLASAMRGDWVAQARLKEAVSTSDEFPELFRRITQDEVRAQYDAFPVTWPQYSRRVAVPDFKPQTWREFRLDTGLLPAVNGGAPTLGDTNGMTMLPRVPELTEYPVFEYDTASGQYQIGKHGGRFPFSMEAFINDEYQLIQQMPGAMAELARQTEQILTAGVLATTTGPNPAFFNASNGNLMDGNPPLTRESLVEAMRQVTDRRVNGRPVTVRNFALVVPPSLQIVAQEILNAVEVTREVTLPDGSVETTRTNPGMPFPVSVVVEYWLPVLDTSVNADTTWYLVPSGGETGISGRTALVTGFLRGHETPELRISGDQGRALGGGDIDPLQGSFLNDDVQYRVRHFVGAKGLDPSPTIVSNGSGT